MNRCLRFCYWFCIGPVQTAEDAGILVLSIKSTKWWWKIQVVRGFFLAGVGLGIEGWNSGFEFYFDDLTVARKTFWHEPLKAQKDDEKLPSPECQKSVCLVMFIHYVNTRFYYILFNLIESKYCTIMFVTNLIFIYRNKSKHLISFIHF